MKKKFPPEVRLGRVRHGRYGSDDSFGRDGAFSVRRRNNNGKLIRLTLVVTDGVKITQQPGYEGPGPWEHVSVSRDDGMMPTWTDMQWVKDLLWEPEELVVQYHPPQSLYVNMHPGVLHLWKPVGIEIPMPPIEFV